MRRGPGETRHLVRRTLLEEPDLSDEAVGAQLGITGNAAGSHRRALGIPTAWVRRAQGSDADRSALCEKCGPRLTPVGRRTMLCSCGARLRRTP